MKIRKRLSDELLKIEIEKLFDEGIVTPENVWKRMETNFAIGKPRVNRAYHRYHSEWAKSKDKSISDVRQENDKEAAKNGLKSKTERVMFYQNEIERMEAQLKGEVKFNFILGLSIKASHTGDVFMLPIQVQNEIRRTIQSYQSEISKLEGDYAAAKSEVSINTPLSDSQVDKIIEELSKE